MDHGENWNSYVFTLCSKIKKQWAINSSGIYQKQCFVLRLLADCIERYVEWWTTIFHLHQETGSNGEATANLAKQLGQVLENGWQLISLCDEKDSPCLLFTILGCKGQLSEIIDDARIYVQMINRLILRILKSKSSADAAKQLRIQKLMLSVEADCNSLQSSLDIAFEEDRMTLIHSIKLQSESGKGCFCWLSKSRPNIPVSSLLKLLMKEPNINDADLLIQQEQGRGTFGSVHSALWHKLPVAVKTFGSNEYLNDEMNVFWNMLLHTSSHIVHMLGHTEKNRLVLELMEKDLQAYIRESADHDILQKIDLMLQIAKAMQYLHSFDVVHRDLKPSNILVNVRKDKSLLIKLADLGISKDNFKTARTKTEMRGTEMYMAPEMKEDSKYSRKVDVYSFGLVCAEICAWSIRGGKGERPKLASDIPKKLEILIESCMEHDAEKRPSFKHICHILWLVKEKTLIKEVNTIPIELQVRIDGLEGMAIDSIIHPVSSRGSHDHDHDC